MTAARQGGQAAIIILMIVGFAIAALVFGLATPAKETIERDKKTAAALAQAKEALIGYAASDNNRPGSLPCPDLLTNNPPFNNVPNDGSADQFTGAGLADCPSYIGRLPWKTLGVPDLRDGNGERLWYAVSREFARNPSCGAACPLNSDTAGQLTISGGPGGVIAIVFSPGAVALNSQIRDAANENTVANYLEGGNENGGATLTFYTSAVTAFNDRLLPVTREALFPVVEMRVAREVRLSLQNYYTANQYYPYAAPLPGNVATPATYRGYVPTGATPVCAPPTPDLSPYLPLYVSPADPGWFITNNWQQFMVYAVAPRCTADIDFGISVTISIFATPPPCTTGCIISVPGVLQLCFLSQAVDTSNLNCNNTGAGGFLTVDGTNNIRAIVLPAGYRLGGQNRPCAGMADCLEAVAGDNENISADNTYIKPVRSTTNNDNLVVVAPP